MTVKQKAFEYCKPILKDNHNKSYGFDMSDIEDGYIEGYKEGINIAIEEFNDAITQLGLDYNITDEVLESYCNKFEQNLKL